MTERYTQREIRSMIQKGNAHDLDNMPKNDLPEQSDLDHIGYSAGVYGCNGGLFKHRKTGELYAFVGRTRSLWLYT